MERNLIAGGANNADGDGVAGDVNQNNPEAAGKSCSHILTRLLVLRGVENVWPVSVVWDTPWLSRRCTQQTFSVKSVVPGCVRSI